MLIISSASFKTLVNSRGQQVITFTAHSTNSNNMCNACLALTANYLAKPVAATLACTNPLHPFQSAAPAHSIKITTAETGMAAITLHHVLYKLQLPTHSSRPKPLCSPATSVLCHLALYTRPKLPAPSSTPRLTPRGQPDWNEPDAVLSSESRHASLHVAQGRDQECGCNNSSTPWVQCTVPTIHTGHSSNYRHRTTCHKALTWYPGPLCH